MIMKPKFLSGKVIVKVSNKLLGKSLHNGFVEQRFAMRVGNMAQQQISSTSLSKLNGKKA